MGSAGSTIAGAAKSTVSAVGGAATSAAGTVADAGKTAGHAIADTGKSGGNTIADTGKKAGGAIVDAGGAALEALDQAGRDRQARERREAKALMDQLDKELKQRQANDTVTRQQRIVSGTASVVQDSKAYAATYQQYQTEMEGLHKEWQTTTVNGYNALVVALVTGLLGSVRIALVLRGHSIEAIRDSKIAKMSSGSPTPNPTSDYLSSALQLANNGFQQASQSATDVLTKIGAIDARARVLGQVKVQDLANKLDLFESKTTGSIDSLKKSVETAKTSITSLEGSNTQLQNEIWSHLDLSAGDHAISILETPFSGTGIKQFPDGWQDFIKGHYELMEGTNTQISDRMTDRDVAQGKIDALAPILTNTATLRTATSALRQQMAASLSALTDFKTKLSGLEITSGTLSNTYVRITEPTWEIGTLKFVQMLADIATKAVGIDYCAQKNGSRLLDQLQKVPIPTARSTASGTHRGDAPAQPVVDLSTIWNTLKTALAAPPKDPFPEFAATSQNGMHHHDGTDVLALGKEAMESISFAEKTGCDKIYIP